MAKTTTTAKAPATEQRGCACGCGKPVERTFLQGHDQRLVSNLASDLVRMDVWDGKCMGILKGAIVRGDQQEKIDVVTRYVREKISDALASKVYGAAMRQWDLEKTRDERAAKRKAAKDAKATAPKRERKTKRASEVASEIKNERVGQLVTATASNDDVDAADAELETNDGTGPGGPRYATGQSVRVLIGKRKRNAKVHGMNQAGKVTAIALTTNGKETVRTDGFMILT